MNALSGIGNMNASSFRISRNQWPIAAQMSPINSMGYSNVYLSNTAN
jgi:hypothetical protein